MKKSPRSKPSASSFAPNNSAMKNTSIDAYENNRKSTTTTTSPPAVPKINRELTASNQNVSSFIKESGATTTNTVNSARSHHANVSFGSQQ